MAESKIDHNWLFKNIEIKTFNKVAVLISDIITTIMRL